MNNRVLCINTSILCMNITLSCLNTSVWCMRTNVLCIGPMNINILCMNSEVLCLAPYISCDMESRVTTSASCYLSQEPSNFYAWILWQDKTPRGDAQARLINGIRYPYTGPSAAAQGRYYIYAPSTNNETYSTRCVLSLLV